MRLYRTAICSLFTYGSEAWQLDVPTAAALNGANSRCVSRITGRSNHEEASARTRTYDLVGAIKQRRHKWLGHILRMKGRRLVKLAAKMQHAQRTEGSLFMHIPVSLTFDEVTIIARNRKQWRQMDHDQVQLPQRLRHSRRTNSARGNTTTNATYDTDTGSTNTDSMAYNANTNTDSNTDNIALDHTSIPHAPVLSASASAFTPSVTWAYNTDSTGAPIIPGTAAAASACNPMPAMRTPHNNDDDDSTENEDETNDTNDSIIWPIQTPSAQSDQSTESEDNNERTIAWPTQTSPPQPRTYNDDDDSTESEDETNANDDNIAWPTQTMCAQSNQSTASTTSDDEEHTIAWPMQTPPAHNGDDDSTESEDDEHPANNNIICLHDNAPAAFVHGRDGSADPRTFSTNQRQYVMNTRRRPNN